MKLLRYEEQGVAKLGALREDHVVGLDGLSQVYPTMLSLIAAGQSALDEVQAVLSSTTEIRPLEGLKLLAPIERPGKFLAIGMNFKKLVEEAKRLGIAVPEKQFWFNKQTSCIAGPFDPIEPGATEALDYEVELIAIVGTAAKSVSAQNALSHIFGFMVGNDVSARDWQRHSPTFTIGKSFDTHGPIGPWIVTSDEVPDPQALPLRCIVNGEVRQNSDTGQMVHDIAHQIEYLSTAFTLDPGDLIATGTPEGVGVGMTPPRFLQPGDVVRCEIDGIGSIENVVAGRKR
jgi:2-keto-4-pentenoate hydratase/2-oxohepta-3-ene-1,7-dioic acid hydratase in catechol pathway